MPGLRRINSHFCRKRLHLLGTECLLNLIARDGLVFAHADPGGKDAATAALRKLIGQTLQSPALCQETAENSYERIRFARSIGFSARCTEYRIEKSHNLILPLVGWFVGSFRKPYSRNLHRESDIFFAKETSPRCFGQRQGTMSAGRTADLLCYNRRLMPFQPVLR